MSKHSETDILGNQQEERIFTRISEPLLITDAEGLVQFINPALENMTGYRLSELLGVPIFRLVPKREMSRLKKFIAVSRNDPKEGLLRMRLLMKDEREKGIKFIKIDCVWIGLI